MDFENLEKKQDTMIDNAKEFMQERSGDNSEYKKQVLIQFRLSEKDSKAIKSFFASCGLSIKSGFMASVNYAMQDVKNHVAKVELKQFTRK